MDKNIVEEYCFIIKEKISQQRFDAALDSAMRLKKHFPQNELGYYYCALCEFAKEDFEKSAKHYKEALNINPAHANSYFNLVVCEYLDKKYDDALINIAKALVIFTKTKELDKKKKCLEALKLIESER